MDEQTPVGIENKPTKKLFALFGAIFAVALIAGVSAYYFWPKGSGAGEPPSLQVDISTLSQGKMTQIKGFAKFTSDALDFCKSGTSVALNSRVMHIFSTKDVTFKEIADALKPVKDMQYLIAFYSPGEETGVEPTAFAGDTKTYYLYPTDTAPFRKGADFDVKAVVAGEGVIPAYRGFQVVVDNEKNAALCGDNFKTGKDNIWFADGSAVSPDAVKAIFTNMKVLPAGWVMIPAGYDSKLTAMFYAMLGGRDAVHDIYYQSGANTFSQVDLDKFDAFIKTNDPSSISDINIKDGMTWFYLNESVNVYESFIKLQSGKPAVRTGSIESRELKVEEKLVAKEKDDLSAKISERLENGNDIAYFDIPFSANELALESIAVDMTTNTITFVFKDEVKFVEGSEESNHVVSVLRSEFNTSYSSSSAILNPDGKTVSAVFGNLAPDDYVVTNFAEIVSVKDGITSYDPNIATGNNTFTIADMPYVTGLDFDSSSNKVKVIFNKPVQVASGYDETTAFDFINDTEDTLTLRSVAFSVDGFSADVEFAALLEPGHYVLYGVTGVVGAEEEGISGNVVDLFSSTAKEFDVKTVVSSTPITFEKVEVNKDNAYIFTISFDSEMDPDVTSSDVTLVKDDGITISIWDIFLNVDELSFTVRTSLLELECGRTYTVTLTDRFKGIDGRSIDPHSHTFEVPTCSGYGSGYGSGSGSGL